jgi:hypothetical protein
MSYELTLAFTLFEVFGHAFAKVLGGFAYLPELRFDILVLEPVTEGFG